MPPARNQLVWSHFVPIEKADFKVSLPPLLDVLAVISLALCAVAYLRNIPTSHFRPPDLKLDYNES